MTRANAAPITTSSTTPPAKTDEGTGCSLRLPSARSILGRIMLTRKTPVPTNIPTTSDIGPSRAKPRATLIAKKARSPNWKDFLMMGVIFFSVREVASWVTGIGLTKGRLEWALWRNGLPSTDEWAYMRKPQPGYRSRSDTCSNVRESRA